MAGRPDPKPARRVVTPNAGSAKVAREARCRTCGRPGRNAWPPLAAHHLVPRSNSGDDVEANLVPLCEECHGLLHRGEAANLRGRLRALLTVEELQYVRMKKGTSWLDWRYPPLVEP